MRTHSLGIVKKSTALRVKIELENRLSLRNLGFEPIKQVLLSELHTKMIIWSSWKAKARIDVVFKWAIAYFGDIYADTITPMQWSEYTSIRSESVKASTVNREMKVIKSAFHQAVELGLMNINPVAKIRLLPEEEAVTKYFPLADLQIFLGSYDLKNPPELNWWVFWVVQFFTAARNSELINLTWPDVGDEKITYVNSKGYKSQSVYLHPTAKQALDMLPRHNVRVFPFVTQSTSVNQRMMRDCEKLNLPIYHPHYLRHTLAKEADIHARDIHGLKEVLRHSDIKTTEHYSKFLTMENQKRVVNTVALHFPILNTNNIH